MSVTNQHLEFLKVECNVWQGRTVEYQQYLLEIKLKEMITKITIQSS